MSGTSMTHGGSVQSKQISSRLLNMKFMQRAAAADKNKDPASPRTPASEPPLKRRRTGEYGIESPSTPASPYSGPSKANTSGVRNEIESQTPASKAQNHFDVNTHETEWVLNVRLPRAGHVPSTSSGQKCLPVEDEEYSDDEDDVWNALQPSGRQTFGSFKKKTTLSNDTSTPAAQSKSAKRNAKTNDRRHDKGADTKPARSISDLESDGYSDISADDYDPISSSGSDSESDAESNLDSSDQSPSHRNRDDEIDRRPKPPRNKPSIDFLSEEYNKCLDSIDFHSPGFTTGLGKQRPGLGGGGGGGSSSNDSNRFSNSHRSGAERNRSQSNTPKNRSHLGGQAFFEKKKKRRKKSKSKDQKKN